MTEERISMTEFAKRMGVKVYAVKQAIMSDRLDHEKGKDNYVIKWPSAKKQWEENQKESNTGGKKKVDQPSQTPTERKLEKIGVDPGQVDDDIGFREAERREKVWKAKIQELKFKEAAKQLVKVEDVERRAFELGRKVRDSVMAIPGRLCHELACETDPHVLEVKLTEELIKALEGVGKVKHE